MQTVGSGLYSCCCPVICTAVIAVHVVDTAHYYNYYIGICGAGDNFNYYLKRMIT